MTPITRSRRDAPPLVGIAQGSIVSGVSWREVALHLAREATNREELQAAVLHQLQVMHRQPSGDHEAGAVLRALESALASTPRRRHDQA